MAETMERNGLMYTKIGDFWFPNLILKEQMEPNPMPSDVGRGFGNRPLGASGKPLSFGAPERAILDGDVGHGGRYAVLFGTLSGGLRGALPVQFRLRRWALWYGVPIQRKPFCMVEER